MRLRALILTLVVGILLAPLIADAQQAGKVYRVGYLGSSTRESSEHMVQEFERALSRLGWVQGQNLVIEYRWAEGKYERLPALASELVRLKVDIIVAAAAPPTRAAKQATTTIPIVMVAAGEAVETGLIASIARPGGNITGLTQMLTELSGKRLQLLKEVVPTLSRVAVLWNSANPAKVPDWREIQGAARTLRVRLQSVEVRGPGEFERAFATMTRERPDALITLEDPLTFFHRRRIVEFAAAKRLPAVYGLREFVDAGGLMAYGVQLPDLFRRAATYVDKILKGAKPADLPVEQPTRFELVINLKTAKALGLTVPPSVLIRADEVIR